MLKRMIERELNTPLTSSCGRLFDAVAAVVLGRGVVDYEAQAAIELEGCAVDEPDELGCAAIRWSCSAEIGTAREPARISASSVVARASGRSARGVEQVAHCRAFSCRRCGGIHRRREAGPRGNQESKQVALSGGCLHNRRLARLLRAGLEEEGFQVFQHRKVSPGDGGLSYGQAAVAAAILATRH